MSKQKPSLAVIGTGLAGLSAAYLLKEKFKVTVFERQAKAGMGVHTVDFTSQGNTARIDVPLRIFSKGYYQNLTALYDHIGVEIKGSNHSGVFTGDNNKLLFHYGKFTFNGVSVAYPKGKSLYQLNTLRIAYHSKRFFKKAAKDLKHLEGIQGWSFEQYLRASHTSKELSQIILLPLLSVTLTCDYQSVLAYPADLILGYLTCGIAKDGIIGAEKGVDDIVPRLLKDIDLKVNTAVSSIALDGSKVRVTYGQQESMLFEHVVVASQAHHAAAMLKGFEIQQQLLSKVPFEKSEMSVHTDSQLLPASRCGLSPVSYYIPDNQQRPEVTVDLNQAFDRFRNVGKVYQTWNPLRTPAKGTELARIPFTRPIVTLDSRAAISELSCYQQRQGNRIWFCGSYMADKVPLLDAAVDSSISVAKALGADIPWESNEGVL